MSRAQPAGTPNGLLVVDKPAGITSADVVTRIRRALRMRRVGHTGTLDPMATGVLPICTGDATKLAGYLTADDKGYEAIFELGVETDTLDADGRVVSRREERAGEVGEAEVRAAMGEFVGEQWQVPPMYSAVKQGGTRLHELARAGQTVEREPRRVLVYEFDLRAFEAPASGRPRIRVSVAASKGTYVRSLARDLGDRLGCGAHVAALRRVRAGAFDESMAIPLDEVEPERAARALIAPADAVAHLPAVGVPPERLQAVASGRVLPFAALSAGAPPEGYLRLLTPAGRLVAIARARDGDVVYERVFPAAAQRAHAP